MPEAEIRSENTTRKMVIRLLMRQAFRRKDKRGGRGLRKGDGLRIYDGSRRGSWFYKVYAKSPTRLLYG